MASSLSPGGYVRQGQRGVSPPRSVNVQVAVRCRPLNERERASGEKSVIICAEDRREIICVTPATQRKGGVGTSATPKKTFTYDHVFGQDATQADVYDGVVEPIVDEVLEGYNCTVFAYGQTGTGKTHTMEGGRAEPGSMGGLGGAAGIIPRSVKQVFNHLRSITDEHSVRVSHLELYNEQLTDLLSGGDVVGCESLRMYEDPAKGTFVQGLEDIVVTNEEEIFAVLDKSAAKRKTAETLMNKNSSRSHSVFSITIHIKESTPEGADLLKVGKLNLVDLAGSENVGRSGAIKGRAREAGNINQSLLTLGRVITALVDRHPHIPYRDSKLTRLLQESLGGRNKTCIIATVTPGSHSLEETASTLDYAYRAKSIKNRPTVNQMIAKHVLLKEYTQEILKLKKELDANRTKNGVFLPPAEYERLQAIANEQSETISQLENKNEDFEKKTRALREKLESAQTALAREQQELNTTKQTLLSVRDNLAHTEKNLAVVTQQRDENAYLVRNHVDTETTLHEQGSELQSTLELSVSDVQTLHERIDTKAALEKENVKNFSNLQETVGRGVVAFCESAQAHERDQVSLLKVSEASVDKLAANVDEGLSSIADKFKEFSEQCLTLELEHEETNRALLKGYQDENRKGLGAFSELIQDRNAAVISSSQKVAELGADIAKSISETQGTVDGIRKVISDHNVSLEKRHKTFTNDLKSVCVQLRSDVEEHLSKQETMCEQLKLYNERQFAKQQDILKQTQAKMISEVTAALQSFTQQSTECIQATKKSTNDEVGKLMDASMHLESNVKNVSTVFENKLEVLVQDTKSQSETLCTDVQAKQNSISRTCKSALTNLSGVSSTLSGLSQSTTVWHTEAAEAINEAQLSHIRFQESSRSEQTSQSEARKQSLISQMTATETKSSSLQNTMSVTAEELQMNLRSNQGDVSKFAKYAKDCLTETVEQPVQMHDILTDKKDGNRPQIRQWPERVTLARTRAHEELLSELRGVKDSEVEIRSEKSCVSTPSTPDVAMAESETASQESGSERDVGGRIKSSISVDSFDTVGKEEIVLTDATNINRRGKRGGRGTAGKKPSGIPVLRGRIGRRHGNVGV